MEAKTEEESKMKVKKEDTKTDEPKKEDPKVEVKAEEPKKEESTKEESKKEDTKKDDPKTEEPKMEESKKEAKPDDPKTEDKKEEPKKEDPKTDVKTEEPKKEAIHEGPEIDEKTEEPKMTTKTEEDGAVPLPSTSKEDIPPTKEKSSHSYAFPVKLKRMVRSNRTYAKYVNARAREGYRRNYRTFLHFVMGIKQRVNIERQLHITFARLGLPPIQENFQNQPSDVHEIVTHSDIESEVYSSDHFAIPKNSPEEFHNSILKSQLAEYLNYNYYYGHQTTKYPLERKLAEQYLPIYIQNTKRALRVFEETKPVMLNIIFNYNRPTFLPRAPLPPGIEAFDGVPIQTINPRVKPRGYKTISGKMRAKRRWKRRYDHVMKQRRGERIKKAQRKAAIQKLKRKHAEKRMKGRKENFKRMLEEARKKLAYLESLKKSTLKLFNKKIGGREHLLNKNSKRIRGREYLPKTKRSSARKFRKRRKKNRKKKRSSSATRRIKRNKKLNTRKRRRPIAQKGHTKRKSMVAEKVKLLIKTLLAQKGVKLKKLSPRQKSLLLQIFVKLKRIKKLNTRKRRPRRRIKRSKKLNNGKRRHPMAQKRNMKRKSLMAEKVKSLIKSLLTQKGKKFKDLSPSQKKALRQAVARFKKNQNKCNEKRTPPKAKRHMAQKVHLKERIKSGRTKLPPRKNKIGKKLNPRKRKPKRNIKENKQKLNRAKIRRMIAQKVHLKRKSIIAQKIKSQIKSILEKKFKKLSPHQIKALRQSVAELKRNKKKIKHENRSRPMAKKAHLKRKSQLVQKIKLQIKCFLAQNGQKLKKLSPRQKKILRQIIAKLERNKKLNSSKRRRPVAQKPHLKRKSQIAQKLKLQIKSLLAQKGQKLKNLSPRQKKALRQTIAKLKRNKKCNSSEKRRPVAQKNKSKPRKRRRKKIIKARLNQIARLIRKRKLLRKRLQRKRRGINNVRRLMYRRHVRQCHRGAIELKKRRLWRVPMNYYKRVPFKHKRIDHIKNLHRYRRLVIGDLNAEIKTWESVEKYYYDHVRKCKRKVATKSMEIPTNNTKTLEPTFHPLELYAGCSECSDDCKPVSRSDSRWTSQTRGLRGKSSKSYRRYKYKSMLAKGSKRRSSSGSRSCSSGSSRRKSKYTKSPVRRSKYRSSPYRSQSYSSGSSRNRRSKYSKSPARRSKYRSSPCRSRSRSSDSSTRKRSKYRSSPARKSKNRSSPCRKSKYRSSSSRSPSSRRSRKRISKYTKSSKSYSSLNRMPSFLGNDFDHAPGYNTEDESLLEEEIFEPVKPKKPRKIVKELLEEEIFDEPEGKVKKKRKVPRKRMAKLRSQRFYMRKMMRGCKANIIRNMKENYQMIASDAESWENMENYEDDLELLEGLKVLD